MPDAKKIGDAKLAQKVIEAYADGIDGFTMSKCRDIGEEMTIDRCYVLTSALGKGAQGTVTDDERAKLSQSGFSDGFIYELARDSWRDPLHRRARWLADHAVKKWWRIDYGDEDRAAMLSEIGAIGVDASEGLRALVSAIRDESAVVREAAAAALPGVLPAFAHNIDTVLTSDGRGRSDSLREAFNGIGYAVAPAFAAVLKHPDKDVRRMAARILAWREVLDAKHAVSALIEALKDPDLEVRYRSANALGNLGPDGKRAVPALIAALKDPASEVRESSAEALGNLGQDAKEAIPALGEALKNTTLPNYYAGLALFKIDNGTIIMIVEVLKDRNLEVSRSAWSVLLHLREKAVPSLAAALGDEDSVLRTKAAETLGSIGKESYPALPFLEEMRDNDPDPDCRRAAREAVEQIEKEIR